MQLSHGPAVIDAVFDEANLVSCAGLVPVLALAEGAGLSQLLAGHLSVASPNAPAKVVSLLAGMVAGADSIEDMDLLRHGGMDRAVHWRAGAEHVGHVPAGVQCSGTCGSWTRSLPACWLLWRRGRRCCRAPSRSPTLTSTTRCVPRTVTPSRAPGSGTRV